MILNNFIRVLIFYTVYSASLAEAEWNDDLKLAKLTKVTKNLTKNFSHSFNKSLYLYPEECLCLLEMVIVYFNYIK